MAFRYFRPRQFVSSCFTRPYAVLTASAIVCAVSAAGCSDSSLVKQPVGQVIVKSTLAEASAPYLGNDACRQCHENIIHFWGTTGHARSLDSLREKNAETRPECLRCHTTGYGTLSGFSGTTTTPSLSSVGCEACHGPGTDHSLSTFPGSVPPQAGPDCPPCEIKAVCVSCHTLGHSPDFHFSRYLARISCREGLASSLDGL